MKLQSALILAVSLLATSALVLRAQGEQPEAPASGESSTPWFTMHGSLGLSAEYYDATSSADALGVPIWTPRRPANLYRLVFSSTATFFDKVSIPINIVLNSTETNTITPATVSPTIAQFLENPLNAISINVRPGVDWAELQLGTHLPQYSDLLGSDVQIFGAGFSATPSIFRLGFNTGIVQRAIAADTLLGNTGAYRRHLTMAKLGFGNDTKWFVDVNVVAMHDDTMRLASGLSPRSRTLRQEVGVADPVTGEVPFMEVIEWDRLPAEEGIMTSLAFRAEITDMIAVVGEAAATGRSRDITADTLGNLPGYIPRGLLDIFVPRESSTFDGAVTAGILLRSEDWGADFRVKYYGPGFTSFSIPFMMADFLDLTVSPRFALFDNRVSVSGTVGQRIMNYSSTTGEQLSQIIIASNLSWIVTDAFSISGTFNNYGIRNGVVNDTLRIQNVARSIIVTPSLFLSGSTMNHSISVSGSIDTFDDFNVVSGRFSTNNTLGVFGNYTASWTTMPLILFGGVNYLRNDLEDFGFTMMNVSVGGSYGLFDNKVTPNLSVGLGQNTLAAQTADLQLIARLSVRWNITDQLSLTAGTSTNSYMYGSSRPGAQFSEYTSQVMLVQNF